jgi:hypothetical protein
VSKMILMRVSLLAAARGDPRAGRADSGALLGSRLNRPGGGRHEL